MFEDIFDVIIVGVGLVGLVVVLVFVCEGVQVLVIECGNFVGVKNVIGGCLYVYSLECIIFGFVDQVFIECMIIYEKFVFMIDNGVMIIDYCNGEDVLVLQVFYFVLCSKFDVWLMEQVEEEGV